MKNDNMTASEERFRCLVKQFVELESKATQKEKTPTGDDEAFDIAVYWDITKAKHKDNVAAMKLLEEFRPLDKYLQYKDGSLSTIILEAKNMLTVAEEYLQQQINAALRNDFIRSSVQLCKAIEAELHLICITSRQKSEIMLVQQLDKKCGVQERSIMEDAGNAVEEEEQEKKEENEEQPVDHASSDPGDFRPPNGQSEQPVGSDGSAAKNEKKEKKAHPSSFLLRVSTFFKSVKGKDFESIMESLLPRVHGAKFISDEHPLEVNRLKVMDSVSRFKREPGLRTQEAQFYYAGDQCSCAVGFESAKSDVLSSLFSVLPLYAEIIQGERSLHEKLQKLREDLKNVLSSDPEFLYPMCRIEEDAPMLFRDWNCAIQHTGGTHSIRKLHVSFATEKMEGGGALRPELLDKCSNAVNKIRAWQMQDDHDSLYLKWEGQLEGSDGVIIIDTTAYREELRDGMGIKREADRIIKERDARDSFKVFVVGGEHADVDALRKCLVEDKSELNYKDWKDDVLKSELNYKDKNQDPWMSEHVHKSVKSIKCQIQEISKLQQQISPLRIYFNGKTVPSHQAILEGYDYDYCKGTQHNCGFDVWWLHTTWNCIDCLLFSEDSTHLNPSSEDVSKAATKLLQTCCKRLPTRTCEAELAKLKSAFKHKLSELIRRITNEIIRDIKTLTVYGTKAEAEKHNAPKHALLAGLLSALKSETAPPGFNKALKIWLCGELKKEKKETGRALACACEEGFRDTARFLVPEHFHEDIDSSWGNMEESIFDAIVQYKINDELDRIIVKTEREIKDAFSLDAHRMTEMMAMLDFLKAAEPKNYREKITKIRDLICHAVENLQELERNCKAGDSVGHAGTDGSRQVDKLLSSAHVMISYLWELREQGEHHFGDLASQSHLVSDLYY